MKNCIRPPYEKLKPLKLGFIENSNFENIRDPCNGLEKLHYVAKSLILLVTSELWSGLRWRGKRTRQMLCAAKSNTFFTVHNVKAQEIAEDWHDLVQWMNLLRCIFIHTVTGVSSSTPSHCRKRCQTPRSTRATQPRAPTCPGSRSIGPTGCRSWSVTRTLSPPSGPAGYEIGLLGWWYTSGF